MVRTLSMLCLVGCGSEAWVGGEAPPPPVVTLDAPAHLVVGAANTFTVTGPLAPGERVYLLGSRSAGAGPCPAALGGACLGLLPPVRILAEAEYDGSSASPAWTVPANLGAGRSLSFQAVVVRGLSGVDTGVSEVATLDTESPLPGCTDWTASNYDPAANQDDGSCTYPCPGGSAWITSQDDVARYADCVVLDSVALHQTTGVIDLTLPHLVQVTGDVYFHQNVDLENVSLPALQSVGRYVYFHQNLALTNIDMPALETVDEYLYLHGNTALSSADFSSVSYVGQYVYFNGNSSWCVPHDVDWAAVNHAYFHSAGNACD